MVIPEPFKLFGLEPKFVIDQDAVNAKHKLLMQKFHPDLFANRSAAERRVAEQWCSNFNEAHRVLTNPVLRAKALCEAAGHPIDAENNTKMDPMFLMTQMENHEQLDDARGHAQQLEALHQRCEQDIDQMVQTLAQLIDHDQDFEKAKNKVRELMFLNKFLTEIQSAQSDLND